MRCVLTADLGGTKCRFAAVAEDLRVVGTRQVATPPDRDAFLAAVVGGLREVGGSLPGDLESPAALGVGTAGVIARDGTRIRYAPNLPVSEFPLAEHLARETRLQTILINDGRASALGEYRHGFAAGADPLLVLFFGTGVGIGLIVDGKPYEGANNAAGEIGHTPHRVQGRVGPNGLVGSYEAYCGGGPMTQRAVDEIGPPPGGRGKWTIGDLVELADRDPRAARILAEAEQAASMLVAGACTLLNPAAVVLGGGVLKGWPALAVRIEAFVRSWCSAAVLEGLRFVRSRGESDAILWGAAEATRKLW
jgi:glucokinase